MTILNDATSNPVEKKEICQSFFFIVRCILSYSHPVIPVIWSKIKEFHILHRGLS